MILPTAAQIKAGNEVASELISASCQKNMGGLGGSKKFRLAHFKYKKIIKAYLMDEVDSVTGIWIAMQEAEFK